MNRRVSVVVPTYNCEESIGRLLDSLIRQSYSDFEVIIVDSSTDETYKIAGSYGVKVVRSRRLGVNNARNIGLKLSIGDIVCFTDGDCWVDREWIENIVKDFNLNNRIGCVGGSVVTMPTNLLSRYMNETIVSFFPKYNSRSYIVAMSQVFEQPFGDVRLPVGCNMAFRRKILMDMGGFDEGFIGGYEEFDVMINLLKRGWYILVDPRVKVYHEPQTSITKMIRKTYMYGKGARKLIGKHKLSSKLKFKRGFEGIFRSIKHSIETYKRYRKPEVFTYPVFDILFGLAYYFSFTLHKK
ncbi:MAG: glycosyltransferase [Candidatus Methanomethylicia archaeon]